MNTVIQLTSRKNKKANIIPDGFVEPVCKKSHAADHVTENMVAEISEFFISKKKFRDNLLFILGCNCGLRCGEIVSLKWGQVLTPEGYIRSKIVFIEEKNSRKGKIDCITGEETYSKIKSRVVDVNDVVYEAIAMYMETKESIALDEYVFKSESRSAKYYSAQRKDGIGAKADHLTRQAVDLILKKTIKEALGYIDLHISTHTMRKTFARYVWENAPESQKHDRARFLQKMLGHASLDSTLHYIGVTQEEMTDTYKGLCLGKRQSNQGVVYLRKVEKL